HTHTPTHTHTHTHTHKHNAHTHTELTGCHLNRHWPIILSLLLGIALRRVQDDTSHSSLPPCGSLFVLFHSFSLSFLSLSLSHSLSLCPFSFLLVVSLSLFS